MLRADSGVRGIRDPVVITAMVFLGSVTLLALAAPLLPLSSPNLIDPFHRLQAPTLLHPFGTDNLGRDILSRLVRGSRWSLGAVGFATVLIMSIGVSVGVVAGYFGGLIDDVLMRIVDVFLSVPSLLFALAIGGILGPGFTNVILALVAVWWASYARLVRGLVIAIRDRDFMVAARSLGGSDRHIMVRHLLPNILPTVAVLATIEMGDLVMAVAALGFLGVGVQAPNADWGTMISDARPYLLSKPMLAIWSGLAITLTVMSFNVLGDALRNILAG